jgi:Zn-dependent protease
MQRSWKLGSAFRIPVYVHWTFLFLPLLILIQSAGMGLGAMAFLLTLALAVFACVLLHEFGHALMARNFGIRTRNITLYPIGGVASLESIGQTPLQELAIALAGPAVNLVIFLLLSPALLFAVLTGSLGAGVMPHLVSEPTGLALDFLAMLALANIILLVFNLLPAFPMDGGRVLRAFLSLGMPRLRATEIAATIGLVMAGLFVVAALFTGNFMLAILAVFVGLAGQAELRGLRQLERPSPGILFPETSRDSVFAEEPIIVTPRSPFADWGLPGTSWGRQDSPPAQGFTGFAFDPRAGVWVRWLNGRPVQEFTG